MAWFQVFHPVVHNRSATNGLRQAVLLLTPLNLTAGVYTLTVTDQIGCTINATTTINEPPAIVVETDTTPATCGMANGTANCFGLRWNWPVFV